MSLRDTLNPANWFRRNSAVPGVGVGGALPDGAAARGLSLSSGAAGNNGGQTNGQRQTQIARAWNAYWGGFPPPLKATPLDPTAADNTLVGLARKTVDTSAFFLFGVGAGVGFNVDDGQTPSATGEKSDTVTKAEKWLQDCFDAQDGGKAQFLLEMGTAGGVSGMAWVRVMLPVPSRGEDFPQLIDLDAENVSVTTDPSNYRRVLQFRIQTTSIDPDTGRQARYRTVIDRVDTPQGPKWDITEQSQQQRRNNSFGDWQTTSGPTKWPYDWCPVFYCKNRPAPLGFNGTADLEADIIQLNEKINFVLSNINRILRAHGHPLLYTAGANIQDIDRAIGGMLKLHNENAKVGSVEMMSDLQSSFDQLTALLEKYHELTSIPEIVSGKLDNVGQLSGLAMQVLYGPVVILTGSKRLLYGTMLCRLCEALLEIADMPDLTVSLSWPSIVPTDPAGDAAAATAKQAAGVSKATTIKELGYDPEHEADQRKGEAADAAESMLSAFDKGPGAGVPGQKPGSQDDEKEEK